MYQQFRFNDGSKINEIIKAGSMGHGTAVFGDFDVDLVIYSDGKPAIIISIRSLIPKGHSYN